MKTTEKDLHTEEEKIPGYSSLKGTFAAVGIVGVIIVIMWVAVFLIYMVRV